MPDPEIQEPMPSGGGLKLQDVLYIIFRHKWLVAVCFFLGVLAAGVLFLLRVPLYESSAKLLVLYVTESGNEPTLGERQIKPAGAESIMNAEVQILSSWDLLEEVARSVGPARVLGPKAVATNLADAATLQISRSLAVKSEQRSSVITLAYANSDPSVPQSLLTELIERYRLKHRQVHQGGDNFEEVARQKDQFGAALRAAEEELRELKRQANVVSFEEAQRSLLQQLDRVEQDLRTAEVDLEGQRAKVRRLEDRGTAAPASVPDHTNLVTEVPPAIAEHYRVLKARLDLLQVARAELLKQWTEASPLVQNNQAQLTQVDTEVRSLEASYSRLTTIVAPRRGDTAPGTDVNAELARVAEIEARVSALKTYRQETRSSLQAIDQQAAKLAEIERRKSLAETNYYYFSAKLEQARLHQSLDGNKVPNISVVQSPSPALRLKSGLAKKLAMALAGGLALGVGLAFLIELVLDQRIRLPGDVEKRLNIPVLLSIPRSAEVSTFELAAPSDPAPRAGPAPRPITPVPILPSLIDGDRAVEAGSLPESESSMPVALSPQRAPWDTRHALRPYFEALRDRLMLFFQLNRLLHKPKLVAVTACSEGAGASTLAAGLAAALSETGDGNVLLVDMNLGKGAVHPFFRGSPGTSLARALEPEAREDGQIQDKLYVATVESRGEDNRLVPLPKRLHNLMPKMRASDYDYIIFDMPPMSQTSVTVALAASMDQVLLVMEGDKTLRHDAKRAFQMLKQYNANVSGIFNKQRVGAPAWLMPQG